MSPKPGWAQHAIDVYVRDDDPPQVICELAIEAAQVLDLRDAEQCANWGIDPATGAVPWRPEREKGYPASSWQLSDLAREKGADGIVFSSRRVAERWHLVLFRWHDARLTGRVMPYPLP